MDSPDVRDLGLFPLGLVILPGERVPLHIFEPRYRALVADCALESRPFVIALATDDGVAKVGCAVRLDGLIRRFADGRMNIVIEGVDRVELTEQTAGRPYLTATARTVPDKPSESDEQLASTVSRLFHGLTEAVAGASSGVELRDGVPLSYAVSAAIDLDAPTKQRLLEERSEAGRLATVRSLLEDALSGLDRQTVAAERAQTNGKVTLE